MYSRNYGFSNDTPAKINPPPSYSGSVIGRDARNVQNEREQKAPESPLSGMDADARENEQTLTEEKEEAPRFAPCNAPVSNAPKKEKGVLSGIFSGLDTQDLILLGIIAALALGLWESDILLVALIVAVVLM